MNKKDLIPVIVLALLIPAWILIDRTFIAPKYPAQVPAQEQPAAEAPTAESTPPETLGKAVETVKTVVTTPATAPAAQEVVKRLENEKVQLELTSFGGGIKSATLLDYPELNEDESGPVVLTFPTAALAYDGIDGLSATDSLNMQPADDGKSITFSRQLADGIVFQRTVTMGESYLLTINDRFVNNGSAAWHLQNARILTGRMQNPADMKATKGVSILGVDSYTPAGELHYWGKKLGGLYKNAAQPMSIDLTPPEMNGVVVDWVSAKNKFFTQILRPDDPVATMSILSSREAEGKRTVPKDVAAALEFNPEIIEAGGEFSISYHYYIGPKKYSVLKETGYHMEKVMEFETVGFWSFMNWLMEPARRFLLWTMNQVYSIIPSYGIAIILLTLLVRILFWPLTHKSTESMKRMQELQPEIKAIQEKYKGKKDQASAKKMQAETMALYKEKKVNPMGGCLPMFVQIPVFIALFTVLRNAIELRYAGFLWIADLSAAENLFAGKIPFIGALNILPLVMSVSMIWQQKLTGSAPAATPEQQQQQKMMMFMMPIMMLFFFYTMPSGLVLYWTTSNLMMIAQTGLRNLRKKTAKA